MFIDLAKYGKELYKHDSFSREKILKYSEKNFRKVLKYAYKNSDFYKKLYLTYGIKYEHLNDIKINDIPIIEKSQIREYFYDIQMKNISKEEVLKVLKRDELLFKIRNNYIVHTSGTTGSPTNFLYDKRALKILSANFIRLTMEGGERPIKISDIPLKNLYIAPVGGGYACTALALFGMSEYRCKNITINAQTPLNQWGKIIKNYNPTYLSGYPSCLNLVATLQEKGEINIHPKKIITGGEPLTKGNIIRYKETFGADIIDYYGCTESIFIGAKTSFYDEMYLYDDLNYVEIDSKNHLIITPLYNRAFPLVRYRLSDVVEGFNKKDGKELPYTSIKKIVGRDEQLMWFVDKDGKRDFLHPLFLDDLNIRGVNKYQFVQKSLNYFEIRCICKDTEDKSILKSNIDKEMAKFLKNKSLENLKYNIKFVDSMVLDKNTGKIKMVIKEI